MMGMGINNIDYPKEWDELPKRERNKKIKELKKQKENRAKLLKKARNIGIIVVVTTALIIGYKLATKKSPEEVAFQEAVEEVSLEGRVEEYEIEGKEHVAPGTDVEHKTN